MLSPRRFVLTVLACTLALASLMVAANVACDPYGVFHPTKGRRIALHFNERLEKNLLSRRYVPENFNALLLGPSTSFNIDTKKWTKYAVYNMSILAGTITELKTLLENYLAQRTPALVVIGMYPYMLKAHGMKTEYISDRAFYSVLGSMDLVKGYVLGWYHEASQKRIYNDYGWHEYEEVPVDLARQAIEEKAADPDYPQTLAIDPIAWREYLDLIETLRERKTRIVQYYHPLPRPVYEAHREFFDTYYEWTRHALPPDAITINFNTLEFYDFTSAPENYQDDCHLSGEGAQKLGEYIYNFLLDHIDPQSVAPVDDENLEKENDA